MRERIAWLLLAALHALPGLAFVRPALLTRLYGVGPGEASYLLLQHRAALFVVVVLLCATAAFDPQVRRVAVVGTALAMLSFLALYVSGGQPPNLRTIALADAIGLLPLAYVAWRAFAA